MKVRKFTKASGTSSDHPQPGGMMDNRTDSGIDIFGRVFMFGAFGCLAIFMIFLITISLDGPPQLISVSPGLVKRWAQFMAWWAGPMKVPVLLCVAMGVDFLVHFLEWRHAMPWYWRQQKRWLQ